MERDPASCIMHEKSPSSLRLLLWLLFSTTPCWDLVGGANWDRWEPPSRPSVPINAVSHGLQLCFLAPSIWVPPAGSSRFCFSFCFVNWAAISLLNGLLSRSERLCLPLNPCATHRRVCLQPDASIQTQRTRRRLTPVG